ncbi:MAG: MarR family transcriptional regulator [Pacificimonas sp.]
MADVDPASPTPRQVAEMIHQARIRRRTLLTEVESVFRDPAWDILLELYLVDPNARPISASGIGLDTGVPRATAMRHVRRLEDVGFIERLRDKDDARREYLRLTTLAKTRLETLFAQSAHDALSGALAA